MFNDRSRLIGVSIIFAVICAVNSGKAEKHLKCNFVEKSSYECIVVGLENDNDSAVFSKIIGNHAKDKSNDNVTVLNIRTLDRQCKFVPTNITNFFPNLQNYQVRGSGVVSVSRKNFDGLRYLNTIILDQNLIEKLDENVFEDLRLLQTLQVRDNKITELSHKIFATNTELEIINLDNNKVTSIHEKLFASLHKLRKVYFRNNLITELRDQTFANNNKITTIDFRDNNLIAVGPHLLKNLVDLKEFKFFGNPCIQKSYKTIDELIDIFESNCFPPYLENYKLQIVKLTANLTKVDDELKTCESNLTNQTEEKDSIETEKNECIAEKETCDTELTQCQNEKDEKEKDSDVALEDYEKTKTDLQESFKNLTECQLSKGKCVEDYNLFKEKEAIALKEGTSCLTEKEYLRNVILLNQAHSESNEIKMLKKQVNQLEDDKRLMQTTIDELKANEKPSSPSYNTNVYMETKKAESCDEQNEEIKTKLKSVELELKSALNQLPICNSFLLVCTFEKMTKPEESYACKARHISACQPGMRLTSVEGTHDNHKSNWDVTVLDIKESLFHFPDNIFRYLPNLKSIRVKNSGLSSLQPKLTSTTLRSLNIVENKFHEIPARIFEGISNLNSLILENNEIQLLHYDSFAGLSTLRELSLKHNWISNLPNGIFHELTDLTAVSLNNNRLMSLNGDLFRNNLKLEIIQFNDNPDLKLIGKELLDYTRSTLRMIEFRNTCLQDIKTLNNFEFKQRSIERCNSP